jgi:alkaline phosphatase D
MTVSRRFLLTRGLAAAAGSAAVLSPSALPRAAASADAVDDAAPAGLRPLGRGRPDPDPVARPSVANPVAPGPGPGEQPVPLPFSEKDVDAAVEPVRALRMPFTLGVASGDPTADGVVLWTRLAPDPLAPDGRGGMPRRDVEVQWQLADDESFRHVVRTGVAVARQSAAHSVHVELTRLSPGREFFYRFRAAGHTSPTGRTRTAPPAGSRRALNFAVTSCAHWEHGWFTAYRHVADARPDLVLNIGDYFYEAAPRTYACASGFVREHVGGRSTTLAGFRRRHAQYKTDPDLQAAHAAAPWVVAYDDHEVQNNWAGDIPGRASDLLRFPRIRTAAMRAYYEHMPLRKATRPSAGSMQLYRRLDWGSTARFHVLDTRQYRDDQACSDGVQPDCRDRLDPTRTLLGARQEAWLGAGLRQSHATWDFLAQQVFFSPNWLVDVAAGTVSGYNMDSWDGYPAARDRLLDSLAAARARNLVVLTGDAHSHWASEILHPYTDLTARPLGVELVASSISSDGNGARDTASGLASLKAQPYLRYFDQRRGWIHVSCTADQMRADFHVLDYVSLPLAPDRIGASFAVENGNAKLLPV